MALTQMQIIQSLGEAMNWLERELSWGANPAELRHLMGRIGELYVAMYTNGSMANGVNEKGYDVVTRENERISVKTTSKLSGGGHVLFNPNTLEFVDRIVILGFNEIEMELEILLDASIEKAKNLMSPRTNGKVGIALSKLRKQEEKVRSNAEMMVVKNATYWNYEINELESGTIEISKNGVKESPAKPVLRKIAADLSIPIVNSNGNAFNTRQLGSLVIRELMKD